MLQYLTLRGFLCCAFTDIITVLVHNSCDSTLRAGREYYNASGIAKKLCTTLATEDWSKLVSLKLCFLGTMMRLTQMHALIDALCTVPVAAAANSGEGNDTDSSAAAQQHSALLYRLEAREPVVCTIYLMLAYVALAYVLLACVLLACLMRSSAQRAKSCLRINTLL
jgi:hypothetical protein